MRKPHYLEPLKTDKIPAEHIVFDCETRLSERAGSRAHRWACGAVAAIEDNDLEGRGICDVWPSHSPGDLWTLICGRQPRRGKLVVWAHNLSFDLRVSEALRYLPQNGYALEAIVLERTASWASFTGPRGSLLICDLYSWLPGKLDDLAGEMGKPRPRFDYANASPALLQGRCLGDVTVTAEIVCQLLAYVEAIGSGPFRPTGSGQSHAIWRRNHLPAKTVFIHGDEYALERERTALWAGRAEAWRHGDIDERIYEHDLNLAYCRIAATAYVPVKLLHRTGPRNSVALELIAGRQAVLADVEVTTTQPLVPTGEDGRVYWPVGTFRTTLWDPELRLLTENGARVKILRSWVYETAPVLQPMAREIIAALEDPDGLIPVPLRKMVKHWARTIVGRCALRYRQWEDFGTVDRMGLSLSTMFDTDTGEQTELLHVGEKIMELSEMQEADSSVPQITGWIMSQARANVWAIMQRAGLGNVLYVDTDGILVNRTGHARLTDDAAEGLGGTLVHKSTWTGATINGPRNLILDRDRRIAGVPVKAVRVGDTTFDGEVWAGVKASLSGRQLDNVAVTRRLFEVTQDDKRRRHVADGKTLPYEVTLNGTD